MSNPPERKPFYHGKILTFATETESDGEVYDIVEHSGAAVMLPVDADGLIHLVTQSRRAIRKRILELPAGSLEDGEDPLACAQRELREEIGMRADSIQLIQTFYPAPSFCTEKLYLYLAKDLSYDPLPMDENEDIEVVKVSLSDALQMCISGEIVDAKTLIGIYYLALDQKKA